MKCSFIIPAYNVADTLERAVSSIEGVNTNLEDEILIVENGSTDNTFEVAKKCADKYTNIRVLTSDKGVSKARNKGIKEATGDWIVFMDADDECMMGLQTVLGIIHERLSVQNTSEYKLLPNILDMVICSYKKDYDLIIHNYKQLNTVIYTTDELKAWMISKPTLRMQVWAKVYRADFLRANKLFFNEALSYSEDSEFVIRALQKSCAVFISNIPVYQYHSGTLSAMRGFAEGRTREYINSLETAKKDIVSESLEVKRAFQEYIIAHINIIGVHDIFGCEVKLPLKRRCDEIRKVMNEDIIKSELRNMRSVSSFHSLPVLLCKYRLSLLAGIIYYGRSLQNRNRYRKAKKKDDILHKSSY